MNLKTKVLTLFLGAVFMAVGCTQQGDQQMESTQETATDFTHAVAVLHTGADSDVSGTVHFEQVDEGVRVTAEVSGLEAGKHGFHIHQFGDCTAGDFTSAGGHYNPEGTEHGAPTNEVRHVGDMGNLVAGENGTATIDYVDPVIALNGNNSVIGRAVILHAGADDLESQPSGAAGSRIACGVIGIDEAPADTANSN